MDALFFDSDQVRVNTWEKLVSAAAEVVEVERTRPRVAPEAPEDEVPAGPRRPRLRNGWRAAIPRRPASRKTRTPAIPRRLASRKARTPAVPRRPRRRHPDGSSCSAAPQPPRRPATWPSMARRPSRSTRACGAARREVARSPPCVRARGSRGISLAAHREHTQVERRRVRNASAFLDAGRRRIAVALERPCLARCEIPDRLRLRGRASSSNRYDVRTATPSSSQDRFVARALRRKPKGLAACKRPLRPRVRRDAPRRARRGTASLGDADLARGAHRAAAGADEAATAGALARVADATVHADTVVLDACRERAAAARVALRPELALGAGRLVAPIQRARRNENRRGPRVALRVYRVSDQARLDAPGKPLAGDARADFRRSAERELARARGRLAARRGGAGTPDADGDGVRARRRHRLEGLAARLCAVRAALPAERRSERDPAEPHEIFAARASRVARRSRVARAAGAIAAMRLPASRE